MSTLAEQIINAFQAGHGVLSQREASARADAELQLQKEKQQHDVEMALQTLELARQAHEFASAKSGQELASKSSDPRKSSAGTVESGGVDLGTMAPGPRPEVQAGGMSFPLQFIQDLMKTKDEERQKEVAANVAQAGGEAQARDTVPVTPDLAAAASAMGMGLTPGGKTTKTALELRKDIFTQGEETKRSKFRAANQPGSVAFSQMGDPREIIANSGLPDDQKARLAQVPPADLPTVIGLVTGLANPSSLQAGRGGRGAALKNAARFVDPTWSESTYKIRQDTTKSFTSGPDAANITSLDTVDRHLDTMAQAGAALKNADPQLWNEIKNKGLTAVGDPRVVAFRTAAQAVENELGRAFSGTGVVADEQKKQWRAIYTEANSPQQMDAAIRTGQELLAGRAAALQEKADRAFGSASVPVIPKRLSDKYAKLKETGGKHPDGPDGEFRWKNGYKYKKNPAGTGWVLVR